MARQWKKGLGTEKLKKKDEKKGQFYRAPGDRVSYFEKSVIKRFIPREGKNRVRIIQPLEIEELEFYGLEMHFHRNVGDEGEDLFGDYLCNKIMKNFLRVAYNDIKIPNNCFVCEQQTPELWDSEPGLAKTFYPDRRMWFFVHDLLSDDPGEVLLWSCPWTLHEEILSRSSDEETGRYIDVSDPFEGVPVSFERAGMGRLTKYTNIQVFKKPAPLAEETVDQMIFFKDALIIPEYETVKKAFLAGAEEETGPPAEPPAEGSQQDDIPDCFQKEFDKWKDCETCVHAVECQNPPEKPEKPDKPAKPEKPARPERPSRSNAAEPTTDEEKKQSIRDKIKAHQANRKAAG